MAKPATWSRLPSLEVAVQVPVCISPSTLSTRCGHLALRTFSFHCHRQPPSHLRRPLRIGQPHRILRILQVPRGPHMRVDLGSSYPSSEHPSLRTSYMQRRGMSWDLACRQPSSRPYQLIFLSGERLQRLQRLSRPAEKTASKEADPTEAIFHL
jgi:hypothetical protein